MMKVNRLFAASVAIALLSAPAAAQKPPLTPSFVLSITHKLERRPDTSASGIMKREFGFTKAYITPPSPQRETSKIQEAPRRHTYPTLLSCWAKHLMRSASRSASAALRQPGN